MTIDSFFNCQSSFLCYSTFESIFQIKNLFCASYSNIDCQKHMNTPIIITTVNELVRVYPERIVYISSDGNYSVMVLHDKTEHLFSFNLSHFQQIIEKQMREEASLFIRIGKSLIINREYIYKINLGKQLLILSDMKIEHTFVLSASREALKQLKSLLEKEIEKI